MWTYSPEDDKRSRSVSSTLLYRTLLNAPAATKTCGVYRGAERDREGEREREKGELRGQKRIESKALLTLQSTKIKRFSRKFLSRVERSKTSSGL